MTSVRDVFAELEERDRNRPRIVKAWRRAKRVVRNLPSDAWHQVVYFIQRRRRGFDDRDLFDLDHAIAKFVAPRLREFRKNVHGYPSDMGSEDEWREALDKMIASFDFVVRNDFYVGGAPKAYEEGMALFAKYFTRLWD